MSALDDLRKKLEERGIAREESTEDEGSALSNLRQKLTDKGQVEGPGTLVIEKEELDFNNRMSFAPESVKEHAGVRTVTLPDGRQYQIDKDGNPVKSEREDLSSSLKSEVRSDLAGEGSFADTQLEVDHRISLGLGGTNVKSNLQALRSKKTVAQSIYDWATGNERIPGNFNEELRQEGKMTVEWEAIDQYEKGDIALEEAMDVINNWQDKDYVQEMLGDPEEWKGDEDDSEEKRTFKTIREENKRNLDAVISSMEEEEDNYRQIIGNPANFFSESLQEGITDTAKGVLTGFTDFVTEKSEEYKELTATERAIEQVKFPYEFAKGTTSLLAKIPGFLGNQLTSGVFSAIEAVKGDDFKAEFTPEGKVEQFFMGEDTVKSFQRRIEDGEGIVSAIGGNPEEAKALALIGVGLSAYLDLSVPGAGGAIKKEIAGAVKKQIVESAGTAVTREFAEDIANSVINNADEILKIADPADRFREYNNVLSRYEDEILGANAGKIKRSLDDTLRTNAVTNARQGMNLDNAVKQYDPKIETPIEFGLSFRNEEYAKVKYGVKEHVERFNKVGSITKDIDAKIFNAIDDSKKYSLGDDLTKKLGDDFLESHVAVTKKLTQMQVDKGLLKSVYDDERYLRTILEAKDGSVPTASQLEALAQGNKQELYVMLNETSGIGKNGLSSRNYDDISRRFKTADLRDNYLAKFDLRTKRSYQASLGSKINLVRRLTGNKAMTDSIRALGRARKGVVEIFDPADLKAAGAVTKDGTLTTTAANNIRIAKARMVDRGLYDAGKISNDLDGVFLKKRDYNALEQLTNNLKPSNVEDAVKTLKMIEASGDLFQLYKAGWASAKASGFKGGLSDFRKGLANFTDDLSPEDFIEHAKFGQQGRFADIDLDIWKNFSDTLNYEKSSVNKIVDNVILAGESVPVAGKAVKGVKNVFGGLERYQWDVVMPILKVKAWKKKVEELKRIYPNATEREIKVEAGRAIDDLFQGQDWDKMLARHPRLTSQKMQRSSRIALFAIDYLTSTAKTAKRQYADVFGGGMKGRIGRQALARGAGGVLALSQAVSYTVNGHSTFENDDPDSWYKVQMPWRDEKGNSAYLDLSGIEGKIWGAVNAPKKFAQHQGSGLIGRGLTLLDDGSQPSDLLAAPFVFKSAMGLMLSRAMKAEKGVYGRPEDIPTAVKTTILDFFGATTSYKSGKSKTASLGRIADEIFAGTEDVVTDNLVNWALGREMETITGDVGRMINKNDIEGIEEYMEAGDSAVESVRSALKSHFNIEGSLSDHYDKLDNEFGAMLLGTLSDGEQTKYLLWKTAKDIHETSLIDSTQASKDWNNFVIQYPELKKRLNTRIEDLKTGITDEEKSIRNMGIASGEREEAIIEKFNELETSEEKAALWDLYRTQKIITDSFADRLRAKLFLLEREVN